MGKVEFFENRPVEPQEYIWINFKVRIRHQGCVKPNTEYNLSGFKNFENFWTKSFNPSAALRVHFGVHFKQKITIFVH